MEVTNISQYQTKQRPLSQQIGQRKMANFSRSNVKTAKQRNIKSGVQNNFQGGKIFKGTVLSNFQRPVQNEEDDINQTLIPKQQIRPQTGFLPQNVYNQQGNIYSTTNQNFFDQLGQNGFQKPPKYQYQPPRTAPTGTNPRQKYRNQQNSANQPQKGRDFLQLFQDSQLVESTIFPSIFYAKTSLRNLLQELVFPKNIKPLNPNDDRTPIVFQIMAKLFHEIKFYVFNLLVCQHSITKNFQVFFSDAENIPFSKCCNSPIYVELDDNGQGKVLCNSQKCNGTLLTEFLINYDDGQKLWSDQIIFREKNDRDALLRKQVSKFIHTGKFKSRSLAKELKKKQKNLGNLFENQQYNQSRSQFLSNTIQQQQEFNDLNMLIDQDSPVNNSNKYNNNDQINKNNSKQQFNNFMMPSNSNTNNKNPRVGISRINNNSSNNNNYIQHKGIYKNNNQIQRPQTYVNKKLYNNSQKIQNNFNQNKIQSSKQQSQLQLLQQGKENQDNNNKNENNQIQEDEQTLLDIKNMINDMLL